MRVLVERSHNECVESLFLGIAEGALEGFDTSLGSLGSGDTQFHFHLVVEAGEQVDTPVFHVFGFADDAEVGFRVECLAVVGCNLGRAVDDGSAKLEHLRGCEGFKNQFISDTVGVALRDSHANFSVFHCCNRFYYFFNSYILFVHSQNLTLKRSLPFLFLCIFFLLSLFPSRREQSAGRVDVLSAAGTDGGEDAVLGEIVAEALHGGIVGSMQVDVGNLVKADEVDAAVESLEQADEFTGVGGGVVESAKHDVFERQPPLVGEVVLSKQFHHVFDGHCPVGWHQH